MEQIQDTERFNACWKNKEIHAKAKVGFFIQVVRRGDRYDVYVDDLSKNEWLHPASFSNEIRSNRIDANRKNPKVFYDLSQEEFDKTFERF